MLDSRQQASNSNQIGAKEMPVRSNPQAATAKWVNNLSSSTATIQANVMQVTQAPGAKAAAAAQKWLQNTQAAMAKFKNNVGAVSLQDWQNAMINVGIPRIAQGAQAKQGKMQNFMTQFLPYLQTGVSKVEAMPSLTLEDNIQRAVTMIRHNSQFKRSANTGT